MEHLVFVALGDSLTVGFQSFGIDVPYTYFLKRKMTELLSSAGKAVEVKIHNRGINGDITSNMLRRFQSDVVDLQPDYVIILGGSNDLGWPLPVEEIYGNLRWMYVKALENKIRPVACAVPSILGFDDLIAPRRELNRMIEQYCAENKLTFVDLFKATADPSTGCLLEEYSDDGLHMTKEGYMRVADEVFKALKPFLV